ncbi:MAG: ADP-ribosyltransferase [Anaeroplasmataceae bacterium]|nr:ADP-ribosyltransferase [Anaeroplasmataceae bacterium]
MTDEQKNSIRFYTTNDYLLINGILWEENDSYIDDIIKIINADGLAVMHEAEEQGYDLRWKYSKEDGLRLYKIYQECFPAILNENTKIEIINRARQDIQNMLSCQNTSK